jgi:N-acetylglutamate synthase-like GNAT family acetyltransferase
MFSLRLAVHADVPALTSLIDRSARGLSRDCYSDEQIDALMIHVFGVDTELIRDGTFWVAEADGGIIGCGGWSRRRTLFGGDRAATRQNGRLDPAHDAAKIRAFFVDPAWARRGVGRALLARCEAAARAAGFQAGELMATLPGQKLYAALGYQARAAITHDAGGVSVTFVPMVKAFP